MSSCCESKDSWHLFYKKSCSPLQFGIFDSDKVLFAIIRGDDFILHWFLIEARNVHYKVSGS